MAKNETRLPDYGQPEESGKDYTSFWPVKAEDATHSSSVKFAIRTKIANTLMSLPQVVSDRLMILKIDLCMLQP